MVLLARGVDGGVACDLEGEEHLSPTFCHPCSLQLPVVGTQEEEGVETGIEARWRRPEIHTAAPRDEGQQGTAYGTHERGPRHDHLPSLREGLWRWRRVRR